MDVSHDFELRAGHRFTFRVPANPKAGFDGIVRCEVLECEPPSQLTYSWSAGALVNTRVSYRLEPDGDGTRLLFEHAGFDVSQPWGEQAFRGAEFGWEKMLEKLPAAVADPSAAVTPSWLASENPGGRTGAAGDGGLGKTFAGS